MSIGWKFLFASIVGAATLPTHAANFLVGSGAGCQFSTIQAAVNAAAANPGADTVRIANGGTYFAEAVAIGAQDLTIDGQYNTCAAALPAGTNALISGLGGAAAPVFSITGAGVRRFQNLSIIRGDQSAGGEGGGINFDGSGELILSNVGIAQNAAGFGGGINFRGAGGAASLTLLNGTVVQLNQATSGGGGGIRMEGAAQVYMQEPNISISNNQAPNGAGGGLLLLDDTYGIIASEGIGTGVIVDNSARDGGGIAVVADTVDDRPILLMYSSNAAEPVSIRNNVASQKGGGIYLDPFVTLGNPPLQACLLSFNITGNRAQNGAAIYGDVGDTNGVIARLNNGTCGLAAAGIIPCTANQYRCNAIGENLSETTAGVATDGATILIQDAGQLLMQNVWLYANRGGSVVRTIEQQTLQLSNALIAGNTTSGPLVRVNSQSGDFRTTIQHNTIASNAIGGTQVIQFEDGPSSLKFNYNLIWQPGKTSVTLPFAIANNAESNWDFNGTSDSVQILPPPWQAFPSNPRFTNAALGDFRLRVGSSLVDRFSEASTPGLLLLDLDDRARPTDLGIVSNSFGTVDVGAFERQETDAFLVNGQFDGSTTAWPSDNPSLTSYSTLNAPGSTSGSLAFLRLATVGATTPAYNAGVQCFNVPSPGTYRLSAAGRGTATNFTVGTSPYIFWRVRNNSANCVQADPVALEGNLNLPNQSAFANVAAPAVITIGAGQWTPNTTIELRLDVRMGILDAENRAGFDNIQLTGETSDKYFANGFE